MKVHAPTLSNTPIRVVRGGKPQSVFIDDLRRLYDQEIVELDWHDALTPALQAAPHWTHSREGRFWHNTRGSVE
jgi:hypothetical protein